MNPRPSGYEPDELPAALLRVINCPGWDSVVERDGFEPSKAGANRFTVCSLWATREPLHMEPTMGLEPATC